jgi:hypothetical protein
MCRRGRTLLLPFTVWFAERPLERSLVFERTPMRSLAIERRLVRSLVFERTPMRSLAIERRLVRRQVFERAPVRRMMIERRRARCLIWTPVRCQVFEQAPVRRMVIERQPVRRLMWPPARRRIRLSMRGLIWSSVRLLMFRLARFRRCESGSFTLETSIIYPTILLAVISIVFLSLFVYEKASLYQAAAEAAERSAFTWDNSGKDWETGDVVPSRTDGLYWRTGSDGLGGLFSFGSGGGMRKVTLPLAGQSGGANGGSSPESKLAKAAGELPGDYEGELTYRHGLIDREVTADLGKRGNLPFLAGKWTDAWMGARVTSVVTEPVELIRNVDFVRTFVVRVKDLIAKPKAAETVPVPAQPEPQKKLVFAKAKDAAAYLRSVTGGVEMWVDTPSQKRRQLDVLDADGLVHEVKLGYTSKSKDVEAQIAKDIELMRSGTQVKGVVWHFFRKEKDGKVGPSKPLRQYLEQQGIIVVIHQ